MTMFTPIGGVIAVRILSSTSARTTDIRSFHIDQPFLVVKLCVEHEKALGGAFSIQLYVSTMRLSLAFVRRISPN